jgi:hypothetical protein
MALLDVLPAAKIDGEVFYQVAKKYNLGTDNDSMNRIVNLVNQGMSPDDAGKALSQGTMTSQSPQAGGLLYMDYPNPYGVRAYPTKDGYGGEMLPKSTGWLGLLQGQGDLKGSTVTELSADDSKGSFPLVVPTLTEVERNKIAKGIVTKEMQKKAMDWRDLMQSQGLSPFYNSFNYGK